MYNYVRLIKKLGLINVFAANIEFPESARALLLRGDVKTNAFCSILEDAFAETSGGQQCKSGAAPLAHNFSYKQCKAEASDTDTTKKSSCPSVFFPAFLQTAVIDKLIPALFVSALQSAAIGGL